MPMLLSLLYALLANAAIALGDQRKQLSSPENRNLAVSEIVNGFLRYPLFHLARITLIDTCGNSLKNECPPLRSSLLRITYSKYPLRGTAAVGSQRLHSWSVLAVSTVFSKLDGWVWPNTSFCAEHGFGRVPFISLQNRTIRCKSWRPDHTSLILTMQ